ncbi:hypothetical protein TrLO_g14823, partial [Triparma laevis f. longispina]
MAPKRKSNPPPPYSALDLPKMLEVFEQNGFEAKQYHIDEFQRKLHKTGYPDLNDFDWHSFPQQFVDLVMSNFKTHITKVVLNQTSSNETTTKLLVELHDGHRVESVIMRHETGRTTLCVSSQVGCQMGCTFCATGTMGIIGNLSAGEILEQLVHADRVKKIRNIVFMGMGEPLNNFENVKAAVTAMVNTKQFGLAFGHVTVSTVGVTPKIRRLTAEMPFVNLALSLHAPNQEMRSAIVPAAKAYKIEGLIEALDDHMKTPLRRGKAEGGEVSNSKKKVRKAMIQYTMLEGPTATFECAHQLGKLCEKKNIIVNLIPYNTTDVKDKFQCPSMEHIEAFQKIVMGYGLYVFIRKTMGEDIAGACGQLVLQKEEEEKKELDVEDAGIGKNIGGGGEEKVAKKMGKRRKGRGKEKSGEGLE